jgi:phytoene synthase
MHDAFSHCEDLVRAGDRERFLATLFAPATHRPSIFALYAYNLEIVRIREAARAPLAGEVRLQWWRDVLLGDARGEGGGHPVAAALVATIARYGLQTSHLTAIADARGFDLYDEPMPTLSSLEAYADATSANLISLCARILEAGRTLEIGNLAHHAGNAHAITGLLAAFAAHARRGQLYLPLDLLHRHGVCTRELLGDQAGGPQRASRGLRAALAELRSVAREHLARARDLLPAVPATVAPALLPVALVPAMLARMQASNYDPFAPVEIAPWQRAWLIWRAGRRPDRIFRAG